MKEVFNEPRGNRALLVGTASFFLLEHIERIEPREVLTRTGVRMQTPEELNIAFRPSQAGVKISAEWFAGLKALLQGVIIVSVLLALISSPQALYLLLLLLYCFAPEVWLNEHITKRKVKIQIDIVDLTPLWVHLKESQSS